MDEGLEEILARFDPEAVEVPWPRQNVVGYGVGPKKVSEHFCYIAFHKDHVNLGFNQGAELPDPAALLEGPGKTLRHTKITGPENLEQPALRKLVDAAAPHRLTTRPTG